MTIQKPAENHALRPAAATPISVREALGLFLQAYQYPHLGNEDARESLRLEEEARELSAQAVHDTNDPPEFAAWLSVLTNPRSRVSELETVYFAMLDDGPAFGLPVRI